MEVPEAHGKEVHVFVAEAFGTCFLVYAVNMQASFAGGFGVFGIAFTLFAMITMFGGVSGGNFNPAVTLGVLVSRPTEMSRNFPLFLVSSIAQYVGGFIGMMLSYMCLWQWNTMPPESRTIATLKPTNAEMGAYFTETVCSFIFILVILTVKNPITAPSKEGYLNCWTVGITLLSCITLCGGQTGAALNPAVGLVQVIFENWQFQTGEYYKYIWIYILGPYTGGLLAGLFSLYHVWSTKAVLGNKNEDDSVIRNLRDDSLYMRDDDTQPLLN